MAIKFIYTIICLPASIFNFISNYFLFKVTDTQFNEFPSITGRIVRKGRGKMIIGNSVKITSNLIYNPVGMSQKCLFYVAQNAKLTIGNNVGISNSLFYSNIGITIKDNVLIGGGCQFLDNDFHSIAYNDRILMGDKNVISKPIVIEEGAFIGASSIILKGVTIGRRSVVGCGSVVTKDIPDNEIWAGNPAKFIKSINDK